MRKVRLSWVFFAFLVLCIIQNSFTYGVLQALPKAVEQSSATKANNLKDIRLYFKDDHYHVVLEGSQPLSYRAIKVVDPLRVVVDLPNTSYKEGKKRFIVENEVIEKIEVETLVLEPEALTRVAIYLSRDLSFKTRKFKKQLWISLIDL